MMRKFATLLAAFAVAASAFVPADADARDRRGGYYDRHHHGYYHHDRRHRRDNDGDAVVAGVVGLALGLAIGALANQPQDRRASCYDNYRRCDPPRDQYYEPSQYEDDGYYEDSRAAYERDYGVAPDARYEQCTRQERQWDRYAERYVVVDVPC